jgi:hypothetical protein
MKRVITLGLILMLLTHANCEQQPVFNQYSGFPAVLNLFVSEIVSNPRFSQASCELFHSDSARSDLALKDTKEKEGKIMRIRLERFGEASMEIEGRESVQGNWKKMDRNGIRVSMKQAEVVRLFRRGVEDALSKDRGDEDVVGWLRNTEGGVACLRSSDSRKPKDKSSELKVNSRPGAYSAESKTESDSFIRTTQLHAPDDTFKYRSFQEIRAKKYSYRNLKKGSNFSSLAVVDPSKTSVKTQNNKDTKIITPVAQKIGSVVKVQPTKQLTPSKVNAPKPMQNSTAGQVPTAAGKKLSPSINQAKPKKGAKPKNLPKKVDRPKVNSPKKKNPVKPVSKLMKKTADKSKSGSKRIKKAVGKPAINKKKGKGKKPITKKLKASRKLPTKKSNTKNRKSGIISLKMVKNKPSHSKGLKGKGKSQGKGIHKLKGLKMKGMAADGIPIGGKLPVVDDKFYDIHVFSADVNFQWLNLPSLARRYSTEVSRPCGGPDSSQARGSDYQIAARNDRTVEKGSRSALNTRHSVDSSGTLESKLDPELPRSSPMGLRNEATWPTIPREFSLKRFLASTDKQNDCGNCYLIATMGMLEARIRMKYGREFKMSSGYLENCNYYAQGDKQPSPAKILSFIEDSFAVSTNCEQKKLLGPKCEYFCPRAVPAEILSLESRGEIEATDVLELERLVKEQLVQHGPLLIQMKRFVKPTDQKKVKTNPNSARIDAEKGSPKRTDLTGAVLILAGWSEGQKGQYWEVFSYSAAIYGESGWLQIPRGPQLNLQTFEILSPVPKLFSV